MIGRKHTKDVSKTLEMILSRKSYMDVVLNNATANDRTAVKFYIINSPLFDEIEKVVKRLKEIFDPYIYDISIKTQRGWLVVWFEIDNNSILYVIDQVLGKEKDNE